MRCDCCDRRLSNREAVLIHKELGHYLNTCMVCLQGLNIPYQGKFLEDTDDDEDIKKDINLFDWQSTINYDE